MGKCIILFAKRYCQDLLCVLFCFGYNCWRIVILAFGYPLLST